MARAQIVQVSRCVEELLQACYELLEARELEDAQATRSQQMMMPPKAQMEQVLLCHRQANGSCERLLLDLQQAQVLRNRLKTQGTFFTGPDQPMAINDPKLAATVSNHMPVQRLEGLLEYERAMQGCMFGSS